MFGGLKIVFKFAVLVIVVGVLFECAPSSQVCTDICGKAHEPTGKDLENSKVHGKQTCEAEKSIKQTRYYYHRYFNKKYFGREKVVLSNY